MKSKQEIMQIINHSTGTTQYHKYSPFPGYPVITDGVKAVAEAAGGYWLADLVGSWQGRTAKLDKRFQVWKLKVKPDRSWVVQVSTRPDGSWFRKKQDGDYTDFPLDALKLYLCYDEALGKKVLMLPGEY